MKTKNHAGPLIQVPGLYVDVGVQVAGKYVLKMDDSY